MPDSALKKSKRFIFELKDQIAQDHLLAFAGNLAYHSIFALIPLAAVLISLLGLVGATGLVSDALDELATVLPADALSLIRTQLESLAAGNTSSTFGFGIAISIAVSLFAVSGGVRSIMEALNVMNDVTESRGIVRRYIISILLSLLIAVVLGFSFLAIVINAENVRDLADYFKIGSEAATLWIILRWPLVFVLLSSLLTFMYWQAPNLKQPLRYPSAGSLTATIGWIIFSLLFSLYANNFANFDATYGSIAGAIVFILFAYYASVIVLIGAEIDQIIRDRKDSTLNKAKRRAREAVRKGNKAK